MSLPAHFPTPEHYFDECLQFFDEYQSLYNFSNTEILVKNILESIDIDNLEDIDVFKENYDLEKVDDSFLNSFFEKLKRLQVFYDDVVEDKALEDIFDVPLSPKKKHEIVYLAREIKEQCAWIGCSTVVDFGSGLGYLDQLIYETTNFKVLGLESSESNYVGAKKRQGKYHENSKGNVKYVRHTITAHSSTNIDNYLVDKFGINDGFCITGLHACADLAIHAINVFLKMEHAAALVLMPCCYHKMVCRDERFQNFPLSTCMRRIYERHKGGDYMKVPFLRLGAQPPKGYEKLENSVFNLLARAVLELYAQKNNCKLKRNKRKAVKMKSMENNFENYLKDASRSGFTITKNGPENEHSKVEFNLEDLRLLWRKIDDDTVKRAGVFVLLQNNLQPIIENVVLFDRLVYLKENGIKNCKYKKIFNETLSPRCLALLACK